MSRVTPQQAADKWARRLSGATDDIRAGIERVSEAPGKRAAAKRAKWEAGVRESADKWQRNVGRVSLDDWKNKALKVGLPRIASGAAANVDKAEAFFSEFLPFLDAGVAKVRSMPDTTLEDRINRSVQMMRHNAGFQRGGSGR